jgi:predicted GIY-YIG superfamily endonuclease
MYMPNLAQMRSNDWYCYVVMRKRGIPSTYSGATCDLPRRLEQHNGQRAGGSRDTRMWGIDNAKLVIKWGPFERSQALSVERRLKNTIIPGGGLRGRLRAIVRLLTNPRGLITRNVTISQDQLRSIPIDVWLPLQSVASLTDKTTYTLQYIGNWNFK